MPGIDYRIHGADEYILVSGMEEAVLIYMEAIKNLAGNLIAMSFLLYRPRHKVFGSDKSDEKRQMVQTAF